MKIRLDAPTVPPADEMQDVALHEKTNKLLFFNLKEEFTPLVEHNY